MPLTEQAAIALEESIAHWAQNVAAETPDDASVQGADCALCSAFPDDECTGCPVVDAGFPFCEGTPYYRARTLLALWRSGRSSREAFRVEASAELAFLKSLRDPPASPETAPSEALK